MRILPFFLLFLTCLFSENMTDKGINILASGKPEKAYEVLEEAYFKTKDPKAIYYMGYLNFIEFQKYSDAMRQMRTAANMGYLEASYQLGNIYYKSRKYETARRWLKKSANKGHAKSIYLLGYMFEMGIGVTKSASGARFWYQKIGIN